LVRDTSIEVYHKIKENGLLQTVEFAVYEAIFFHGPLTIKEACRLLPDWPETSVSPTFARLKKRGSIKEIEKRPCRITGNTAYSCEVTKNLPLKLEKPKREKCSHCDGKGYTETQQSRLF